MDLATFLALAAAPAHLQWQMVAMIVAGGGLLYLAIAREYEPMLLLPRERGSPSESA